jgi:hypothetical protein
MYLANEQAIAELPEKFFPHSKKHILYQSGSIGHYRT